MKNWSTSVDTRPGQLDTRDRSQRNMLTCLHLRSTLNQIVSTLESLPRRSTRDEIRSTLESLPRRAALLSGT
ncbi:hypothetical protein Taro_052505 [Colocasia esculenta]|uniref:Uncharacterized protein n=1 Tax=Colocasia esculenta TaxID=4460 RepID=A0A843XK33_COLES|nr:hypothetical protein [Colocasia esculenta]